MLSIFCKCVAVNSCNKSLVVKIFTKLFGGNCPESFCYSSMIENYGVTLFIPYTVLTPTLGEEYEGRYKFVLFPQSRGLPNMSNAYQLVYLLALIALSMSKMKAMWTLEQPETEAKRSVAMPLARQNRIELNWLSLNRIVG